MPILMTFQIGDELPEPAMRAFGRNDGRGSGCKGGVARILMPLRRGPLEHHVELENGVVKCSSKLVDLAHRRQGTRACRAMNSLSAFSQPRPYVRQPRRVDTEVFNLPVLPAPGLNLGSRDQPSLTLAIRFHIDLNKCERVVERSCSTTGLRESDQPLRECSDLTL